MAGKKTCASGCAALFSAVFLLTFVPSSTAKEFKGAKPGVSTRKWVIEKFGEPYKEFSKGGRLSNALNYQGDNSIEGALEVNFYFDKNDILFRVDVWPTREINTKQVEQIFGKKYQERVTKKGHRFFNYYGAGMVVFFEKDRDVVHSFMFTESRQASRKKKTGSPSQEKK